MFPLLNHLGSDGTRNLFSMEDHIRLQLMRPLSNALVDDDNWTGLTDAQARRKRQNRLNQRAYRRRKEQSRIATSLKRNEAMSWVVDPETGAVESKSTNLLHPFYFPLSVDHLLTLVQFNVYRALLTNMTILSLPRFFSCEAPASDIAVCSSPLDLPELIPSTLIPTPLQRSVSHEPWIDLFPLPALRDNIIKLWGSFDCCEICDDVLGTMYDDELTGHGERNGIVVWGDPWDVNSWELMEGFVGKWGHLLSGCHELIYATNRWRASRGEDLLTFSA